jgi:hypothetical protein
MESREAGESSVWEFEKKKERQIMVRGPMNNERVAGDA